MGMPAVINEYVGTNKLVLAADIQNKILGDYLADMAKYATNTESQRGGTANVFGASIDWLGFAGVVLKCQKTEHGMDPILVYSDLTSFKLYMGDVGLLTMKTGISQHVILNGENNCFMGAIAENYVA